MKPYVKAALFALVLALSYALGSVSVGTKFDPVSAIEAQGGGGGRLRTNEVRTRHLFNGSVTSSKLALVSTTVTVALGAASGASSANAALANATLLSCTPSSNQDQFVDNVVLTAGTGVITVTLAANATAANVFNCIAIKANAQGIN